VTWVAAVVKKTKSPRTTPKQTPSLILNLTQNLIPSRLILPKRRRHNLPTLRPLRAQRQPLTPQRLAAQPTPVTLKPAAPIPLKLAVPTLTANLKPAAPTPLKLAAPTLEKPAAPTLVLQVAPKPPDLKQLLEAHIPQANLDLKLAVDQRLVLVLKAHLRAPPKLAADLVVDLEVVVALVPNLELIKPSHRGFVPFYLFI